MNKTIDAEWVNKFIVKEKRERLAHELLKKRESAAERFCHGLEGILDMKKVVLSGDNLTENEVLAFLEKRAKTATCYVIKNADGNMMKLKEGVKTCFDWLGGSVLIAGDTAFFKEETYYGSPMKYLLQN